MKTFNAETIRSFEPCYDPARYFKGDEELTILSLLDMKDIPFEDRLWVILRADFVSEKLMRLFAVWCARQVQHLMTDPRSIAALDVSERFANGQAFNEELDAARAAARDPAWDCARVAAWATASGDASGAAWDAVRYSARAAAWDAVRYSASGAAWDAARDAQESKLREMILAGTESGDVE